MNEAFLSFINIVGQVSPYALAWALGVRAFRFIVGALTGKDVTI